MAKKISTDAVINSVRLKEQASAPDTPASGYFQVYAKDDGLLYYKDDAGDEHRVAEHVLTTAGDLLIGGASGVETRLAIGTIGYVLTVNDGGTAPEWAEATGGSGGGADILEVQVFS